MKKNQILIVDDESSILELACMSLEAEGLSCISASSVGTAIKCLEERNDIAVMVLDWRLDDRSGIEVLRFCREKFPFMPVTVFSGVLRGDMNVQSEAYMAGATAFLDKPFTPTVLVKLVKDQLNLVERLERIALPDNEQEIVALGELQREYVREVVRILGGKSSVAADRLKIHRHTVSSLLKDTKETPS